LAAPHNLPAQLTSFVGRDRELRHVGDALATSRLVSLTGPGGIGKTRLALEAGGGLVANFPNGVWLVQLGAVADPARVVSTVALDLGVREESTRPLLDTLTDALRPRRLLLVLDNCEHVIDASAALASALLGACRGLRILATSREPLAIPGETVWQVPSLSLPPADGPAGLEPALASEAVRLFVERARAARPDFELTERNVGHVEEVCRQLDGIPLAIELAAARLRVLGVEQIAARLQDRFQLLSSGYRTAPPRHQTLRAVLDWSHDLLVEPEQVLLRRLAAFAGGFTLDAAEAVCLVPSAQVDGPQGVLDALLSLVNKSLVVVDSDGRFHLLETVRQYAAEKLTAAGDDAAVRRRHLAWYLELAGQAESALRGAQQAGWLDRLEREHENVRAALRWALDGAPDVEAGLRLGSAVWWFWRERGYASEGRQWLERALAAPGSEHVAPAVRGRALDAAGALAHSQGAYAAARSIVEAALALWRDQGDRHGMVASLNTLGIVAKAEGDHARATVLLEEMLREARALGETGRVATGLNNLATIAIDQGEYARARPMIEESLTLKRQLGDRVGIVAALHNLGDAAYHLGEYDAAATLLAESVTLSRALGATHRGAQSLHGLGMARLQLGEEASAITDLGQSLVLFRDMGDEWGMALCLEGLAQAAARQRGHHLAVQLFATAAVWREANGSPLPPNDRVEYERALDAARDQLGQAAFDAAWMIGAQMRLAQAIDAALALQPVAVVPASTTDDTEETEGALSPREREVAELVARGLTNRQIGDELSISKTTVDRHVSNILVKRGFASRAQLAAWVARRPTPR
jgi:non-specific serine/threonine protein kinase